MEKYTKGIFKRIDLQQICEFLLYNVEDIQTDKRAYDERLDENTDLMLKRLDKIYEGEMSKLTDATNEFYDALSAHSSVFLEIGMKAGARLLFQLLYQD